MAGLPGLGWMRRRLRRWAAGLAASETPRAGDATKGAGDARPLCFQPAGRLRPLFFLHIPKTSGSSINRLLAAHYGDRNMIAHAEYRLPHLMSGPEPTLRLDCVSGHVPLCRWDAMRGTSAYGRATILRDPWARLVSHVNWTNRFNHGKDLPPDGQTLPVLTRVVRLLAETDFTARADLRRLFDAVDAETEFMAFDNMQVRMLVTGHPRANFRKPGQAELENALRNLLACDVWGLCEDQPAFRARLAAHLGQRDPAGEEVRDNPGQRLGLTVDNDLAREIFAPWIALDQALYDRAGALLSG